MQWKTVTYELKGFIISEKGIVSTSNHSDMIISTSTFKGISNMLTSERLVICCLLIPSMVKVVRNWLIFR